MNGNHFTHTDEIGHVVTADELTMDEATIIREQERMAVEKKKRKARKVRRIILLVFLTLILALVLWYFIWGRKYLAKQSENTVKIETTAGQSITYVRVNSINGNEINMTILEEKEETEESTGFSTGSSDSQSGQRPSRGDGNGSSRPQGGSFDGSGMPGGFDTSNLPEDFDASSFGGFSGFGGGSGFGGSFGGGSSSSNAQTAGTSVLSYNGVTYALTDQKGTTMIPVGTVVTTKLGTATTFSRISAGDCLAIVTEVINGKETIMAVYIVG